MAGGRPTSYNDEIELKILARMSEGESVSQICKSDDMPNKSTVWLWSTVHDEFSVKYKAAISNLGSCNAESIGEIEDMLLAGTIDPASARVIIDARKWKAAKFYPKMFSEKQIIESKNETVNYNVDMPITDADKAILESLGYKSDE